jgi:polysaccharide biosynthesis PFTS motif protein
MTLFSKINFINKRIIKWGQRRVRANLKAYRYLKDTGNFKYVNKVKRAIDSKECIANGVYSSHIFGAAAENAERVVRQFLFRGVIENKINTHLIRTLANMGSAIKYPLPKEWREVIRQSGVEVAEFRSAILFTGFVAAKFLQGLLNIGKLFFLCVKATLVNTESKFGSHAFFVSLQSKNIPHPVNQETSYDIVSWYAQWEGRKEALDSFVHTAVQDHSIHIGKAQVVSTALDIQPVTGLFKLTRFFLWAVIAVTIAFVDLFRNRWWHALMLGEAANAALVRIHDPKNLAVDYLFHNSSWIYRPLWTYNAESLGSRILFYFYSTNLESFKRNGEYPEPYVGFKTGTWPEYLVWDEYQASFLRNIVRKEAAVRAVGPIWFQSVEVDTPELPENTIAVFDIQPVRESFYATLAIDIDYYTPVTCNSFLEDIYSAVERKEGILAHKRKRDAGRVAHYQYRNLLKELDHKKNYLSVDPDLAPQILIENCIAVISMPFTSTALIARDMGKPSVYYDPNGLVQKDDKGAHGIPVLSGLAELDNWLTGVIKK